MANLMPDLLSPQAWTGHVADIDDFPGYLLLGGSAVRVVVTEDDRAHKDLNEALSDLAEAAQLEHVMLDAMSCPRLYQSPAILSAVARSINLVDIFNRIARRIWARLGYPSVEVSVAKVAERHGLLHDQLRTDFRDETGRFLEQLHGLSPDFKNAMRRILLRVSDGEHRGEAGVRYLESYYAGTLGARDLYEVGLHRKLTKETATPALRNLLALLAAADHAGSLLHLDLRWVTDETLLTEGPLRPASKSQRLAVYQWVRELIDSVDRFTSTFIVVEFGPQFTDPRFNGRGWGLYDALRLRLEDGVRPAGGPNPSAPFVPLGSL